jgi:glycosyltransferase involved in cell wall biosynthesis
LVQCDFKNSLLIKWIQETECAERFHLLGSIEEAPRFLAGMDIFCLSSLGESSSYALVEPMARGVPAVVTDVDAALEIIAQKKPDNPLRSIAYLIATIKNMQ